MINKENIEHLLQKYFDGETQLKEEKKLRYYFLFEEVAPEHLKYKPLFSFFEDESKKQANLDVNILIEKPISKTIWYNKPSVWGVAAALLIAISVSWFQLQSTKSVESLSHQEVLLAQKYLSIGFNSLDNGYQKSAELMSHAKMIDKNTQEIEKLGNIYNQQMKQLKQLNHIKHIDQSLGKLQNISSLQKSKVKLVM